MYRYWHYYAQSGQEIKLSAAHRLQILNAGRLNRQRGPDIRHAKFILDGMVYQGDVEFHLTLADWYNHGHHLDVVYADVLLHLIAYGEATAVRHQISGGTIPTYILPAPLLKNVGLYGSQNCTAGEKKIVEIRDVLLSMALQRFEFKVSAYRSALEYRFPEVVFYDRFFDALGFPSNRFPFRQLAQKMPLALVRQFLDSPENSLMSLTAVYFGLAGFLSNGNTDKFGVALVSEYERRRCVLQAAPVSADNWNLYFVRAQNHPHFRLAAWIETIRKYHPHFLLQIIEDILRQRSDFPRLQNHLFDIFDIEAAGYWKDHFALNKPFKHRKNLGYWGADRITEIIINVILPLIVALAEKEGSYGFVAYLKQFYLWIPADIQYGLISRNMPWYRLYQEVLPAPALFQALLYLNENYCSHFNCSECPLGRRAFADSVA